MKIYFSGSIRGGRGDAAVYAELIALCARHGHVLTEHVGRVVAEEGFDDRFVHDRDVEWLRSCDAVVAEVTTPSLGVGYEIAVARAAGKPILALHRPGRRLSAMIAGAPGVTVASYSSVAEAATLLEKFFEPGVTTASR